MSIFSGGVMLHAVYRKMTNHSVTLDTLLQIVHVSQVQKRHKSDQIRTRQNALTHDGFGNRKIRREKSERRLRNATGGAEK